MQPIFAAGWHDKFTCQKSPLYRMSQRRRCELKKKSDIYSIAVIGQRSPFLGGSAHRLESASAWFGQGAALKEKAHDQALSMIA